MTYDEMLVKLKDNFIAKREQWDNSLLVYQSEGTPLKFCAINALKNNLGKLVVPKANIWKLTWNGTVFEAMIYNPPDEDLNADDWIIKEAIDICFDENNLIFDNDICNNIWRI